MSGAPKGRTVEQAIEQADVKDRIRVAIHVRRVGLTITVIGLVELFRFRVWNQLFLPTGFRVQIAGGPTVTLTWGVVIALASLVLGPLTSAIGYWLEARAVRPRVV